MNLSDIVADPASENSDAGGGIRGDKTVKKEEGTREDRSSRVPLSRSAAPKHTVAIARCTTNTKSFHLYDCLDGDPSP